MAVCVSALLVQVVAPSPELAQAFQPSTKAAVVQYLQSITGTGIVSGQHNKEPASAPGQYTQQVKDITGQYPGLWGGDLFFTAPDAANRQLVVDQAKREWANGSLVTLAWHACSPTGPNTCDFEGGVKTSISDEQYLQIVTGGTALNATWRQRMAEVVPYLRQLKDDGVPVLFRPFHEMNETWNWWGGRPGVNGSSSDYQQRQSIAGSMPIAIAERGKAPDSALLESQTRWSYFMIWSEQRRENNTNAEIQSTYFHPRVLNQGELTLS
jgi:mannan endo-1,4-beta-mannosidase